MLSVLREDNIVELKGNSLDINVDVVHMAQRSYRMDNKKAKITKKKERKE